MPVLKGWFIVTANIRAVRQVLSAQIDRSVRSVKGLDG
jgi:hypothetical protein